MSSNRTSHELRFSLYVLDTIASMAVRGLAGVVHTIPTVLTAFQNCEHFPRVMTSLKKKIDVSILNLLLSEL